MLSRPLRRLRRPDTALQDEILSLHHRSQLDLLSLPPHLRRDIGLETADITLDALRNGWSR